MGAREGGVVLGVCAERQPVVFLGEGVSGGLGCFIRCSLHIGKLICWYIVCTCSRQVMAHACNVNLGVGEC